MNPLERLADPATGDRAAGEKAIRKMSEALVARGIDPEEIGKVQRISGWQALHKDNDGEAHVTDLYGWEIAPRWDGGPEWPVVQPAAPVKVSAPKLSKRTAEVKAACILPDPQIGYRRFDHGLEPLHDEQAIACALQIIRAAKPDMIVNLGDTMDFAEWSLKFAREPEFVLTTQPTLDRTHRFLGEQIAAAPAGCEVWKLPGNHDNRLADFITKNAMAALRLRQANAPDSWPVLSIAHLLRLDELGVKLADRYPAGKVKIADGARGKTPLFAMHGPSLDVAKLAKQSRQSIIQGHTHRIAEHHETFEVDGEPLEVVAISSGCLARRDGAVPSRGSATDERGYVSKQWENWQHAVTVVTVQPDGYWSHELVEIIDGRAVWRGKEYGG